MDYFLFYFNFIQNKFCSLLTDTYVVPETDVVPGTWAGSIRNVCDIFSEQFEEFV